MSLLSSIFGLTYGPIQCRFSEALTVLPFFLPEFYYGRERSYRSLLYAGRRQSAYRNRYEDG